MITLQEALAISDKAWEADSDGKLSGITRSDIWMLIEAINERDKVIAVPRPFFEGITCHGCSGKGWVAPSYGVAAICPVCGGSGVANEKYVVKHGANSTKIKGDSVL